ncbi:MAG: hypothetical protein D3922_10415 [Candidatus Electrothrix sp. AR1]|nr:hypothetical protein [Candidatus Electrothrix sp. AR1]
MNRGSTFCIRRDGTVFLEKMVNSVRRRVDKLIGAISHVAALKERIACQLEVVPGTSGRSVVQGAGVIFSFVIPPRMS